MPSDLWRKCCWCVRSVEAELRHHHLLLCGSGWKGTSSNQNTKQKGDDYKQNWSQFAQMKPNWIRQEFSICNRDGFSMRSMMRFRQWVLLEWNQIGPHLTSALLLWASLLILGNSVWSKSNSTPECAMWDAPFRSNNHIYFKYDPWKLFSKIHQLKLFLGYRKVIFSVLCISTV